MKLAVAEFTSNFTDCQGKLLSAKILIILDKRQKFLESQIFP